MSSTPEFIAVKEQLNKPGWGYDVQKIPYLSRVPADRTIRKYSSGTPREQEIKTYGNSWILQEITQENGQYVAKGGYLVDLVQPPKFIDGHGNEIETSQQVQDVDIHLVDRVLSAYALDPTPITMNVVTSVSISLQGVVTWTTGAVDFEPFVDYENGALAPSTIDPLPDPDAIPVPTNATLLIAGHSGRFGTGAELVNRRGSFFPNSNKKTKNTPSSNRSPYSVYNFPIYASSSNIAIMWRLVSNTSISTIYRPAEKTEWETVLNDPHTYRGTSYQEIAYASFGWE